MPASSCRTPNHANNDIARTPFDNHGEVVLNLSIPLLYKSIIPAPDKKAVSKYTPMEKYPKLALANVEAPAGAAPLLLLLLPLPPVVEPPVAVGFEVTVPVPWAPAC